MAGNGNGVIARAVCPPGPCAPSQPLVPQPNSIPVQIDPASLQQLTQFLAAGPPFLTQPVSRLAPPRNSVPWHRYAIVAVSPNSTTGDANAILGVAAMAAAETVVRKETVSVVTPVLVGDFVTCFSEAIPDLTELRLTHLGVRVHSQRMLRFMLNVNGTPLNLGAGTNSSAFEFSDFGDLASPLPIYGSVQSKQTIALSAKNLDLFSGYLVEVLLKGYTYPSSKTGPSAGAGDNNRFVGVDGLIR